MPRDWPAGDFDLIVFSESLYYFGGDDLQRILDLALAALRPGGTLLAVHWRHPVPEYPRSGDSVHRRSPRRPRSAGSPSTAKLTSSRRSTSTGPRSPWPRPPASSDLVVGLRQAPADRT